MAMVLAVGLAGVVAFYVALRPCVVEHQPGARLSYVLRSELQSVSHGDEGEGLLPQSRFTHYRIHLYMLGLDGEAALLVEYDGPRRPSLYQVMVSRDGRVRLHDGTRLHDYGPTVGYFDFNLLTLPPGLDQYWHAALRYAYPPPEHGSLTAHVQRTQNGARPRFRWQYPAIEWIDRHPEMPSEQRYVQMRDLDVRYRFDTRSGVWSDARIRFIAGVEVDNDPGYRHERVELQLDLLDVRSGNEQQRHRLQAQVRALQAVEAMLVQGDRQGVMQRLRELRGIAQGDPFLDALLHHWYEDVTASPQAQSHAVQVATVRSRGAAEDIRWSLIADGYPAYISQQSERMVVFAGPFKERDAQVLSDMQRLFPRNRPFWQSTPSR